METPGVAMAAAARKTKEGVGPRKVRLMTYPATKGATNLATVSTRFSAPESRPMPSLGSSRQAIPMSTGFIIIPTAEMGGTMKRSQPADCRPTRKATTNPVRTAPDPTFSTNSSPNHFSSRGSTTLIMIGASTPWNIMKALSSCVPKWKTFRAKTMKPDRTMSVPKPSTKKIALYIMSGVVASSVDLKSRHGSAFDQGAVLEACEQRFIWGHAQQITSRLATFIMQAKNRGILALRLSKIWPMTMLSSGPMQNARPTHAAILPKLRALVSGVETLAT
mmetsp:Transcript_28047/g.89129  ORF Transcript_28047/g.89129 Transcript_28047/m.89129 type:complete len:277 (+) Transcript_28047:331-1161(+)